MFRVLVADDDDELMSSISSSLSSSASSNGSGSYFLVDQARGGEEAINRIRAGNYDLVLLNVNMPGVCGLEALKEIKQHDPSIIVIILTAFSNVRDAILATKEGAYNYLEKPLKTENLVYVIEKALRAKYLRRNTPLSAPAFRLPRGGAFIGQTLEMKKIFSYIDKLSRVDTAVLIRGESGTGKELVAQALHYNGPRKDNHFVTINCSAIPDTLIESEFFGHEKGAFTGADSRKAGKFQYANGGTLFLDEIGDISASMQVKLLRVLQERKFTPVGSNREVDTNVRVVAATNRRLEEMIQTGEFREDLFYRLNVLPVHLPPLRERKNDIEVLATHFIEKFNPIHRKRITRISPAAMDLLKAHLWPGNIRELENVIEHAFVVENGAEITPLSLPETLTRPRSGCLLRTGVIATKPNTPYSSSSGIRVPLDSGEFQKVDRGFTLDCGSLNYQANKEEFEKTFLTSALRAFNGKINQTALHAKIPKKTLLRKLEKYGIKARNYS